MTNLRTAIDTARLLLEPLDPSHADALYSIYEDPLVSRFLFTKAASRDQFREVHRRALAFGDSHGMWAVRVRQDRRLIGRVGFFAFGAAARPELAFLLSSAAWGQGYATEASRAALDHAFRVHTWTGVVAAVRPANTAAIRVLQKLGFSLEAKALLNGEEAALFRAGRRRVDASRPTRRCS